MDEYVRAVHALPAWLAQPLEKIPPQTAAKIQELRLRTDCEIALMLQGRQCMIHTLPDCPPELRTLHLTQLQMDEILYTLCSGSVHTHEAELAEGYLTTATGCRVGIAGRFVQRQGQWMTLQQVVSFDFRIARRISVLLPTELKQILDHHFIGMLLIGEPGSGKTTVLRQIAAFLAKQQRFVTVVDERNELFPPELPHPALECLGGVRKATAVQMALRTLAPQVIVLDELGGLDEVTALEQGFFGGVNFIASVHASSMEEALLRPQVQSLQQHKMLRYLAVLAGREMPGVIQAVHAL